MKPILELLIEDIKYDLIEIENTNESDYQKVYEIYLNIYNRFENLKRDAFLSEEKYKYFERYKKSYRNSGFMLEEGIKNGLYTEHKFLQIRRDLEKLSTYLSISR